MSAKKVAEKPADSNKSQEPAKDKPKRKQKRGFAAPFRALGGYFVGAWQELKQVRWPNRSATWSLTLAVILFSAFFAAIILGLDSAFSYLFKEILL